MYEDFFSPDDAPEVDPDTKLDTMVARFAALADPTRLRILGLLTDTGMSVGQVADRLGAHASTVSRHMRRLRDAEILQLTTRDYRHFHQVNEQALEELWRGLTERIELAALASAIERSPFERRVVRAFTDEQGRVKRVPKDRWRREVIVGYLVEMLGTDMLSTRRLLMRTLATLTAPETDPETLWQALVEDAGLRLDEDSGRYYFRDA